MFAILITFGALAHLVERFHGMEEVGGSNPPCSTTEVLFKPLTEPTPTSVGSSEPEREVEAPATREPLLFGVSEESGVGKVSTVPSVLASRRRALCTRAASWKSLNGVFSVSTCTPSSSRYSASKNVWFR